MRYKLPPFAGVVLALAALLTGACGSGSVPALDPLPAVALAPAFAGLGFESPVGLYELPDGSGRFVVLEQRGRAVLVDGDRISVFIDLTTRIKPARERINQEEGLLGLAFAPDFADSRRVYLNFTASSPQRTVLSRFTARPDGDTIDPSSEEVLLEIEQPFWNHNGGGIAFGPDGYLYIGRGDGGFASEADPENFAQDLGSVLGKILRIDVSGENGYAIPPDNPFIDDPSARPEVWAYGLRNPWRFSWDPQTGEMWAADAGHNRLEEVDRLEAGANLGWKVMEGNSCLRSGCDREGLTLPVIDYPHDDDICVIVGGYVYRGGAIPNLDGAYVYGDFCSGQIWGVRIVGGEVQNSELLDTDLNISSFGTDSAGNLYVISRGGRDVPGAVYQLVSP